MESGAANANESRNGSITLSIKVTTPTMTLNLVSNAYLEESTAKIRVKQVPWEVRLSSLCTSQFVTVEYISSRDINALDISPPRSSRSSRK
jgi:hypothetical protein